MSGGVEIPVSAGAVGARVYKNGEVIAEVPAPPRGHVSSATYRYGCHSKPRPVAGMPLEVQDGYHTRMFSYESGASDRIARMVTVPHVMSTACQYDRSQADQACFGCPHQKGALA